MKKYHSRQMSIQQSTDFNNRPKSTQASRQQPDMIDEKHIEAGHTTQVQQD